LGLLKSFLELYNLLSLIPGSLAEISALSLEEFLPYEP